jgi:general secretion pathway protein I
METFVLDRESGFTGWRRSAENGFTLIETLVAMAIFSLAALALLRLEGATLSSTAVLTDRAIGQIVVRNLAVEVMTDARAPAIGETTGAVVNAGRTWRWVRQTKQTDDARIVRIDLAVTDDQGRQSGALSLARTIE